MRIPHPGRRSARQPAALLLASVATALVALVPAAAAEDVVLRLKGSNFQIEGNLRAFDGAKYVITSSRIGTLTLDASRFDCIGDGCRIATAKPATSVVAPRPQPAASVEPAKPLAGSTSGITIDVSPSTGATLLPDVVKGWAASIGGSIIREIGAVAGAARLRVRDRDGAEIARFDIVQRGADSAFADLKAGVADLVVADRRINDAEAAGLAAVAGNMRSAARETVIGLDAFAVVVAADNPLVSLSIGNMARIFAGEVRDWSELGQPAGRITVYGNATTTGPGSLFEAQVLKPLGRALSAAVEQLPSSAAVAEAVVQEPRGIGVAAYADMRNAKPVNIEQSCGLITQAHAFSIKTEEYPLSRRLYLYTARTPAAEAARKLLAYAASAEAQDIVADNQFVNQTLDMLEFGEHGGRIAFSVSGTSGPDGAMRQLLSDIGGARRLTTTIRFDSGTSQIDSKSQNDLVALVAQLKRPELQRRTIMLLGFSDAVGTAPKNSTLALKRAQQVRASLLAVAGGQIAPAQVVARGYGALAPVACDDNARGHQLNRRVELWVRDAPPAATPTPATAGPRKRG